MTDKYTDLRAALDDGWVQSIHPDTVRDLLADYDRTRDALRWTAGALQMACGAEVPVREADGISINNETRTVAQILDAADAALAQEGS